MLTDFFYPPSDVEVSQTQTLLWRIKSESARLLRMKGHPLEEYVQRADELAYEVVHAWVVNVKAGNSEYLTPEFKGVFDKAFEYRQAKKLADNHRQFGIVTEEEAAVERTLREVFAAAYRRWTEEQLRGLLEAI